MHNRPIPLYLLISSTRIPAVASNPKASLQDSKKFDCKLSRELVFGSNYLLSLDPLSSRRKMTNCDRFIKAIFH
jgi:hypothetical protein